MTIARSAVVMLGTNETTGVTIATTATSADSEVDVLGADTVMGYANVYLKFTSTVTAGSVDLELHAHRITAQDYLDATPMKFSYAPTNATQKVFAGIVQVSRYMSVTVKNNATGADLTNVFVALELFKVT